MSNLPIKRTQTVLMSSYTWWETIDEDLRELTLVSAYTGGAYDGTFVIMLKISKEIHSVVFTTHYILKNFSSPEVKEVHKRLDELTKKIEYKEPCQDKREKYLKSLEEEKALPKINFPDDWEQTFSTSWIREPETKKTAYSSFAKKS